MHGSWLRSKQMPKTISREKIHIVYSYVYSSSNISHH